MERLKLYIIIYLINFRIMRKLDFKECVLLQYLKNVLLTPHISGISWGGNKYTRKRILDIFFENIKKDRNNEPKKNIIDFRKGY